ncbi:beta-galactosidase [Kribbella sp. NPDC005582]|uniref:beta-galactosidase n=1 Tax=Kribbella sp. NPDC005582 TaxID=3156893 RepID=UPI0033AE3FE0
MERDWPVGLEALAYGGDYTPEQWPAEAFRRWLRDRYTTVKELNEAWGTIFWGQTYNSWSQVEPPRPVPPVANPSQQLDWARFTSDALLANFKRERDVLHALSPQVPVTTNFHAGNHSA